MEEFKSKNYADTFLYGQVDYERKLLSFLTTSDEIDKKSDRFADISFDVKRRQVANSLYTVLMSDKVVLLANGTPLPKSFKVFVSKDIRGDKSLKVFIDVSEIIKVKDGVYQCTNIDVMVAYLASAMNCRIYYSDPRRIVTNNALIQSGTEIFADLFTYVLDHLKISGLGVVKTKITYLSALYFQICIMQKDFTSTVETVAARISKISDRDKKVIDMLIAESDCFTNIKTFIDKLSEIFKLNKFTVDVFIEKWVYLYGPSTHFACELYPSFSTMILNAYCGVYLNNQKTIEKRIGNNLTAFCNAIFSIGAGAV